MRRTSSKLLGHAYRVLGRRASGLPVAGVPRFVEPGARDRRLLDPRAPEDDDRRPDARIPLEHLGFHQLEHQADRPQLVPPQKIQVLERFEAGRVAVVVAHGAPLPKASAASTTPK